MVWTEYPLAVGQGLFVQRDGVGEPTRRFVGTGELLPRGEGIGVALPSRRSRSVSRRLKSAIASATRPADRYQSARADSMTRVRG